MNKYRTVVGLCLVLCATGMALASEGCSDAESAKRSLDSLEADVLAIRESQNQ